MYDARGHEMMLGRDQRVITVGTSDVTLVTPNVKRKALIIGAPAPAIQTPTTADGTLVHNADTSTGGTKASYTVAAGVQAILTSATAFSTAVAGVVSALQLTRGATTVTLTTVTTSGTYTAPIPLQPGDVVKWVVNTVQVASTTDYDLAITLLTNPAPVRVTLSFIAPAVLDQGVTLYQGTLPMQLVDEYIARTFQEELHAIASTSGVLVPIVDIITP